MRTNFSLTQLASPDIATSNAILRSCVHCGFCTSTCPTYKILGDELDSPRGRIYLIKDMLEREVPAPIETVKHIDRCLSCLSCMTTCPSGVHYMHLVDHARAYIEQTYKRPLFDRGLRRLVAFVLPKPTIFRLALIFAQPFKFLLAWLPGKIRELLELVPNIIPNPSYADRPQVFSAIGNRIARVALMNGCAQQVLAPEINETTIRLLTRLGVEVVIPPKSGCCGALVHHMGLTKNSHRQAKHNIQAWKKEMENDGLDAIIVNTSGCGTVIKDYSHMFRQDSHLKTDAKRISDITQDITEFLGSIGLPNNLSLIHI